jgi:hypothetical protein
MNILIYGGRDYRGTEQDFEFLDEVMEKRVSFSSPPVVISGNARGADQLGESWANSRNVAVTLFPAKWEQEGRGAGYIRNKRMLDAGVDLAIMFPGGKGTNHMSKLLEEAGVTIIKREEWYG